MLCKLGERSELGQELEPKVSIFVSFVGLSLQEELVKGTSVRYMHKASMHQHHHHILQEMQKQQQMSRCASLQD